MKQFYLINNKQKRVDSDLALTLMQAMMPLSSPEELDNLVGPGYRYRIKATRLVFDILQRNIGPWLIELKNPMLNLVQIKSPASSPLSTLRPIVSTRSPVYISLIIVLRTL